MYRDVVQWSQIRNRILVRGISRRQIVRETGISFEKQLAKCWSILIPQLPAPRRRNHSKLGTAHRLNPTDAPGKKRDLTGPRAKTFRSHHLPSASRDDEGFSGGYNTVADYARFDVAR